MRQSVELLLDEDLDAVVRGQWDNLAAAGLPSQARHRGPTNAPHVTLAVADEVTPEAEGALAAAVVALPVAIRLGGLAVFGSPRRRVLARLVVPNARLLALQQDVWDCLGSCHGRTEYTGPGRWTPHVTLARGLDDGAVARALGVLGTVGSAEGRAALARRWDPVTQRTWVIGAPPGAGSSVLEGAPAELG